MTSHSQILQPPSLAQEAYRRIRDKILSGELRMGAPLSRRQLAEEMEMSFLPVTEAVQRLESEGLVESRPRVGTRVRIPTPHDIRERYIVREALEMQSARLFCGRATKAERTKVLALAKQLDEEAAHVSSEAKAQYAFQSLHVGFHMQIAEWSGSALLFEMLERSHILVFNWLFDVAAAARMPAAWHSRLAEVLVGEDVDAAGLAMANHIRSGMSDIQDAIAKRFGAPQPRLGRFVRNGSSHAAKAADKGAVKSKTSRKGSKPRA